MPSWCQSSDQTDSCKESSDSKPTLRVETAIPPIQIRILDVRFEGVTKLTLSEQNEIASKMMDIVEDDHKTWLEEMQERVQESWWHRGFFQVHVRGESQELSSSPDMRGVALTFHVEEGQQYRLAEMTFKNMKQFSSAQLRTLFPINDGEILDTQKIAEGLEAMRRTYGELGFINFTAVPETVTDDENAKVYLTLDAEEGKQFHFSEIKVIGPDQNFVQHVIREYGLGPGEIFDNRKVLEFAKRLNLDPEEDIERSIDEHNASVCLLVNIPEQP